MGNVSAASGTRFAVDPRKRGPAPGSATALLKVLHLFAHLFDQHLHFERCLGEFRIHGFGTQGVCLAVQLLHQKIETFAGTSACVEHASHFGDVGGKP